MSYSSPSKLILPHADHIIYSSASCIKQICLPLRQALGINHFSYICVYPNNERIHLSMNADFNEHLYQNIEYYHEQDGLVEVTVTYDSIQTWDMLQSRHLHSDAKKYFNTETGVFFSRKANEYIEYFFYGIPKNNSTSLTKLLTHIDLLMQFGIYFKEVGEKLIIQAKQEPLRLYTPIENYNSYNKIIVDSGAIQQFKKIMNLKRLKKFKLTTKEIECAYLVKEGLSAKIIAGRLNRSHRTIEKHIEMLKKKFYCKTKFSLISLLSKII